MKEKEYYLKSKENKVVLRCPIINYCSRRASTIYLFSEYSKYYPNLSMINALKKNGDIPSDFEEKAITVQAEEPSIIRGSDHYHFSNVCPEVNLFDDSNSLHFGIACSEGSYDKDYKNDKKKVLKTKHFSECAEYNLSIFESKKKGSRKKRKYISNKTRVLLQKEINSKCPRCKNEDVDHFDIHHIDENPSNSDISNLLMLCKICHSKITKGDITLEQVENIKNSLQK